MGAVRRYLSNERRAFASIWLLLRRRKDVPSDGVALAYSGPRTPMLIVFAAVSFAETGLIWLIDLGLVIDLVLLVLGLYSALFVFGIFAASVTRPHVVSPREVWIRAGVFYDVRVPLTDVLSLRRHKQTHPPTVRTFTGDELIMHEDYDTNLVLELREPITVTRPLGGTESVRVIRCYAEEPDIAVSAFDGFTPRQAA
ncbi:hypothetical protein ACFWY9_21990 [Amycolatopsis sp. NPDC059027]|uniref:hypothetical protein n=1 Tax=unclassified Amycolatopsis TaxID=2618356 RepID=UPI00366C7A3C